MTRSKICIGLSFVFLIVLVAIGCKKNKDEPIIDDTQLSTWQVIQEQIFEPNCVSCHTAGNTFAKQSGLILTKDVAYGNLANKLAHNAAAAKANIVLLETTGLAGLHGSFLWEKINAKDFEHFKTDHPEYGELMPLGTPPLTNGQLEYIKTWIVAGAPEVGVVANTNLLNDTSRSNINYKPFEPLAMPEKGYQLHLGPFEVAPQFERELYAYKYLGNTQDVYVNRIQTAMRPGTHHLILYDFATGATLPQADVLRDIRSSNGQYITSTFQSLERQVFVFGTQFRSTDYSYPPGVAIKVAANRGFDLNSHYTNYGDTSIYGELYVNLHTIDAEQVQHEAKQLFLNKDDFSLPANKQSVVNSSYTFNDSRTIFMLTAHAHKYMKEFKIYIKGGERDGELIYYTDDWEHPPIKEYDPPLVLKPGEGLRGETTYNNTTNQTLRFGLLSTDEMNIIFGAYY
jgi:hypothetical protein